MRNKSKKFKAWVGLNWSRASEGSYSEAYYCDKHGSKMPRGEIGGVKSRPSYLTHDPSQSYNGNPPECPACEAIALGHLTEEE